MCSWQLFQIVLGFTPRRRPWKAGPSQNDDFLLRFGIHPLQTSLQGTSIPKRFGTTHFRLLCGPFRVICVALPGGLFAACAPLWSFRVFLTCNVRKCPTCLPAPLWHFLLFLIYHIRSRIGLPRTFSSRSITSGAESASHALLAPDLSHQEMARQFLLFGKNFIYFVRK